MMRTWFIYMFIPLFVISQEATEITKPITPNRIFSTPTVDVLRSLDMLLSGGGVVGIESEQYFLGNVHWGFGNLMELEVATSNFIDALKERSATLPASSFKMLFTNPESPFGFSLLIKKTLWNTTYNWNRKFQTRFSDVFLILGYRSDVIGINGGLNIHELRVKIDTLSEKSNMAYSPFFNFTIRANPKTYAMFELTTKSKVNFPQSGNITESDITTVYEGTLGGRYFFTHFFSLDAGVLYRSDFKGPADAVINVILNLAIPLGKTVK